MLTYFSSARKSSPIRWASCGQRHAHGAAAGREDTWRSSRSRRKHTARLSSGYALSRPRSPCTRTSAHGHKLYKHYRMGWPWAVRVCMAAAASTLRSSSFSVVVVALSAREARFLRPVRISSTSLLVNLLTFSTCIAQRAAHSVPNRPGGCVAAIPILRAHYRSLRSLTCR